MIWWGRALRRLPDIVICLLFGLCAFFSYRAENLARADRVALANAEGALRRGLGPRPVVPNSEWAFDLCIFGGPDQPALCTDRKTNPPVYYVTDQHMGPDHEYCRAFASTDLRAVLAFMAIPRVPYRDAACAPDGAWPDWSTVGEEGTKALPKP